jgi:hypothetical protein
VFVNNQTASTLENKVVLTDEIIIVVLNKIRFKLRDVPLAQA